MRTKEQLFELGQRIAYAVDDGRDDTVERLLREFSRDEVAAALDAAFAKPSFAREESGEEL